MCINASRRMTIDQALQHNWTTSTDKQKDDDDVMKNKNERFFFFWNFFSSFKTKQNRSQAMIKKINILLNNYHKNILKKHWIIKKKK